MAIRLPAPLLLLAAMFACADARDDTTFEATAYSVEGTTAAGTRPAEGTVAADPDVLPLNTRIRVDDAGRYSGEYVVRDTGRTITGREIDLYLASDAEAKRFGRKTVRVHVLQWGNGRQVPASSPASARSARHRPDRAITPRRRIRRRHRAAPRSGMDLEPLARVARGSPFVADAAAMGHQWGNRGRL
jgi:3D (Asp-Asp-Asp) domain-containing protein